MEEKKPHHQLEHKPLVKKPVKLEHEEEKQALIIHSVSIIILTIYLFRHRL